MYILGLFTEDAVGANPLALVEYRRMRNESISSVEIVEDTPQGSLIKTPVNVRSLNKHLTDLALNESLTTNDINCLIEIQLTANTHISEIAPFQGFEVAYNNNQDRFQSIAMCTTVYAPVTLHTKLTGASLVTVLNPILAIHV